MWIALLFPALSLAGNVDNFECPGNLFNLKEVEAIAAPWQRVAGIQSRLTKVRVNKGASQTWYLICDYTLHPSGAKFNSFSQKVTGFGKCEALSGPKAFVCYK